MQRLLDECDGEDTLSLDTETTGLSAYKGDRLFAIVIASKTKQYFLNFNPFYEEHMPLDEDAKMVLRGFFEKPRRWYLHNAKFDLAMLALEKLYPAGEIVDLQMLDVLETNTHFKYSLDEISKRWGLTKIDEVKEYCGKNKLFTEELDPETGKKERKYHYEDVPFEMMYKYALNDARITYDLGVIIENALKREDERSAANWPRIETVLTNEIALTRSFFEMEWVGIRVDAEYCRRAIEHYANSMDRIKVEFQETTGLPYSEGSLTMVKVFENHKDAWSYTKLGNPSFNAKAIDKLDHPAAKLILAHRSAKKQIEYFQNFLWFRDEHDDIHANIRQNVTTGRTAYSSPNLQNLTRPEKGEELTADPFSVRRSFIPREGFFFAMLDYEQIEYRLMLDFAGAWSMIDTILETGLDVHQAMANAAGVTRNQAKTVNFLTLYGGGIAKLAGDLGTTESEAKRIQNTVFSGAPEIKPFIRNVIATGEQRGYIFNRYGRRYRGQQSFEYKLSNHLVQGTAADVIKHAINAVQAYLRGYKSRLLVLIHDELVLEVAYGEEFVVQHVKHIMETTYKYRRLPLEVSADYSEKNLADKLPFDEASLPWRKKSEATHSTR